MTRLTKHHREQIATALIKRRFTEQGEALMKRSSELFHEVYDDLYDKETQAMMAAIHEKHGKAFDQCFIINTRANGYCIDIGGINLFVNNIEFSKNKIGFKLFTRQWERFSINCPVLRARVRDFGADIEAFKNDVRRAYREIIGALEACTTIKALEKSWPEIIPLVKDIIPFETKTGVPAVIFQNLNAAYALPPEDMVTEDTKEEVSA
jgi:Nucleotide modification associated domain 5